MNTNERLTMDDVVLKQCILRLKVNELYPILCRWSFFSSREHVQLYSLLNGKSTKRSLAVKIKERCQEKGGLTADHIGELELLYVQQTSSRKVWNAYTFTGPVSKKIQDPSASQVKTKLNKYLRLYFNKNCCTTTALHHGLLWGRVYLPKGTTKSYQPSSCLYFVHYPQTPIIIINGMKSAYNEFIQQCFVGAFGYSNLTDMSLTGHHQEALAELAINKHSEGGFVQFKRKRRLSGPVEESPPRKRKALDEITDDRIVDENKGDKQKRFDKLEEVFGENVQPALERIEYRVELPYRGREVAQELRQDEEIFKSKVVFQGTNVLEGLRNLAEKGYASMPLPKHLTCVPTRARNYFLLSKPKKGP